MSKHNENPGSANHGKAPHGPVIDLPPPGTEGAQEAAAGLRARPVLTDAASGQYREHDLVRVSSLRPSLAGLVKGDFPELPQDACITVQALSAYRIALIEQRLLEQRGALGSLDKEVAESIGNDRTIAWNVESAFDRKRTFGDKLADQIASFGGSWRFLISFAVFLALWMSLNEIMGKGNAFDPYPFILLNLMLSCLAAVQAPVIMMSQKRQEAKDRLKADNDYRVNLKAEIEIRRLQDVLDHMVVEQGRQIAEMHEMLSDLHRTRAPSS